MSEEEKIMIKNITEIAEHNLDEEVNGPTNRFIKAYIIFVGRKVGLKPNQRRGNAVKELWWKRRIQQSMQELQKHINILGRKNRGEI